MDEILKTGPDAVDVPGCDFHEDDRTVTVLRDTLDKTGQGGNPGCAARNESGDGMAFTRTGCR